MGCFSLAFIEQLLIWLVIIAAVVALIRLILPGIFAMFGVEGGVLAQAIQIILWAIVMIIVIYFIFMLLACVMGGGTWVHHP